MPKVTVKFEVVKKGRIRTACLDVNTEPVKLKGGKGSANLEGKAEHELRWYLLGNQGDSISITGKQGDKTIVEVKMSKIPRGRTRHSNSRPFKTK